MIKNSPPTESVIELVRHSVAESERVDRDVVLVFSPAPGKARTHECLHGEDHSTATQRLAIVTLSLESGGVAAVSFLDKGIRNTWRSWSSNDHIHKGSWPYVGIYLPLQF